MSATRAIDAEVLVEVFKRPQPVTIPMVLLFALIPFYLVIGAYVSDGPLYSPEIALDRAIPQSPAWSVIYLSLFVAAFLPVFVVHQQDLVRRTIAAFLMAWLVSFAIFLAYPTIAPHHAKAVGGGFDDWLLRVIYSSDIRYNCFPSLHVAQCFLAAFAADRVHRGVGGIAFVWAGLVSLSTLFTKQHYVLDVAGGILIACVAFVVFFRGYSRDATPELERRAAPALAAGAFGLYGVAVAILCSVYLLNPGLPFK